MSDNEFGQRRPTTEPILNCKGAGLQEGIPRLGPGDARNGETYIYIVAFGDVVKVGRSAGPRERVVQHRRTFAQHGPLHRIWISGPHMDSRANELALIDYCQQIGKLIPGTTEAFSGVPVEAVVRLAEGLPYLRFDVEAAELVRSKARAEYREHLDETGVSLRMIDFHSPDFVLVKRDVWNRLHEESLPRMFGRAGDQHAVTSIAPTGIPDSLVMEMAEVLADGDIESLMDMTFIDIISHAARSKVSLEAALLRTYALENKREDLLRTVRDAWLTGVDRSNGGAS